MVAQQKKRKKQQEIKFPPKQRITAAEKRYSEALVYLHANDININSLTDIHYKKALEIASGFNSKPNQ